MYIFINGSFIANDQPSIHADDRGFLLADGVFTTIKAKNGKLRFFEQHLARLNASLQFFAIKVDRSCDLKLIKSHCEKLLNLNNLKNKTAAVRITISRGRASRGLSLPGNSKATLVISAAEYQTGNNPSAFITSIKRNELSPLIKHKTTGYLENILAKREAELNGYDEGIMLNTKGLITEASAANLFFVIAGKIITPRLADGVFPGIIRQKIINICDQANINLVEKEVSIAETLAATEAFQTNSLVEIQSLTRLNNVWLKVGASAEVTLKLQDLWQQTSDTSS